MSPKTSRVMGDEEDTRGGGGCFGWLFKLFRRKKRGRHSKDKEPEVSLTRADCDDENGLAEACSTAAAAEEDTSASLENEAGTAATKGGMSACQRRRARRKAVAAARKAKLEKSRASLENEAAGAANSEARPPSAETTTTDDSSEGVGEAAHSGTRATKRRRARRKAKAARIRSEAASTDKASVWPSPSVRVYGSEGRPFVTTWEEAAYGAFHAQRHS